MKKKLVLSLAAAALVGTLAVGGTLAWFTDTEIATNVVTTGNVDIAWYESDGNSEKKITTDYTGIQFGKDTPVTPGQNLVKEARIKNEGKNDAYIRAKIVFLEDGEETQKPEYLDMIGKDGDWEDGNDGYYYYAEIVKTTDYTKKIMTGIKINPDKANNDNFTDKEITVRLDAEAVQSDNLGNVTNCKEAFGIVGNDIVSYDTEE